MIAEFAFRHPERIALLALQHIALVAVALTVACAIAVPLGIVAARKPRLRTPLLGVLGALYTVPSLALFAILVRVVGLGFWSAVPVLALYAQFILVRAVAAGLLNVPAELTDAATAMGMTPVQRLMRVDVPLALRVFIAGLRSTGVASIALATLAAYAGAGGLGTLIFEGLELRNDAMLAAGALAVAFLALAYDAILRYVERRLPIP
jgi:osmoprotectant transport system permease protein